MNNENPTSSILVIGGGGYIGSKLTEKLLNLKYKVIAFDKFFFGHNPLIKFVNNPNLKIINGDVTSFEDIQTCTEDVSSIVHLAGLVGDPACMFNPTITNAYNCESTRLIIETAKRKNIQRFIFASSALVYGCGFENTVDENSIPNPVSIYAKSKYTSEQDILVNATTDFHPTILRFSTLFGHSERMRFDLVANFFVAKAYTDGKINVEGRNKMRSFVHTNDVCEAIIKTIQAPIHIVSKQIFNVGSNLQNINLINLAEITQSIVANSKNGSLVEVSIDDTQNSIVYPTLSFSKIYEQLKFTTKTNIHNGLSEIYDNIKNGVYDEDFSSDIYHNVKMMPKIEIEYTKNSELS